MISRVLVVGHGSIGKRHLCLARQFLPDAEIWVYRHRACKGVPEHADACVDSWDKALEFQPELAVIANPATFHVDAALPLARGGAHLLIEKPLSDSSDGVELLLDEARRNDCILMSGYNLRFLQSMEKFRELVSERIIGDVWSIRAEVGQYLPLWRPGSDYRDGVSARRELGGGVLLELSHEIDYLQWVFGDIAWVQATLLQQSTLELDVEDAAHLVLGFASDGVTRPVANVSLDFIRRDVTRCCTVIGSKGSLRWRGSGFVEQFDVEATDWETISHLPHQRNNSYEREWQQLLDCIAVGKQPPITGGDGLSVVQVIESARQSDAQSGQRVWIDRS